MPRFRPLPRFGGPSETTMQTSNEEKKTIDKGSWGPGPWQDEPDRLEFEAHGFPCLIRRSETSGALCGYVGVPPGHPWHGKDHDAIDADVHGGLTYSNARQGDICHVPKPGEPEDVHWLGFDCAHCFDVMPRIDALVASVAIRAPKPFTDIYRCIEYVGSEVESLALQARKAVAP